MERLCQKAVWLLLAVKRTSHRFCTKIPKYQNTKLFFVQNTKNPNVFRVKYQKIKPVHAFATQNSKDSKNDLIFWFFA
jgi:hypothetical protein